MTLCIRQRRGPCRYEDEQNGVDVPRKVDCPDASKCAEGLASYVKPGSTCPSGSCKDAYLALIHHRCFFRWHNQHTPSVQFWIDSFGEACTKLNITMVGIMVGSAIAGSVLMLLLMAACIQVFKKPSDASTKLE